MRHFYSYEQKSVGNGSKLLLSKGLYQSTFPSQHHLKAILVKTTQSPINKKTELPPLAEHLIDP